MELKFGLEGQKFEVLTPIRVEKLIPEGKIIEIVTELSKSSGIWVDNEICWIDNKDLLEHIKQKRLKQVI